MKGIFDTLINAVKLPELRKKLLFTLLILGLYMLGGLVPAPAIDREAFSSIIQSSWGQLGGLMDIISGGGLYSATIFAMGITPYINASIIIQLLTVVIKPLEEMAKEGETGRKKMTKITRFLAIGLAVVQSFIFTWSTKEALIKSLPMVLAFILVAITFTAGTCFVVWLGERINEKGIGNGVSLIIFAGIVTRLPQMAVTLLSKSQTISGYLKSPVLGTILGILLFVVATLVSVAIIIFVIYVQNAERRITVQYSKKTVGRKTYGGQNSYIPIKINQSGVMPVIFTMSIMSLFSIIISIFFSGPDNVVGKLAKDFNESPFYYVFYVVLVLLFTFFYSLIQFNPIEISNSIQRSGGFIPGIRPGKPTSEFIRVTAMRLCWIDGLFLSIVCLVPTIVGTLTGLENVWFSGTSVLILTGVANDLVRQIESQLVTRNYRGFLD
ncbi:MAG TPA: preprotein translocase subunit SecY [Saccharofermentans sp.]|jgi:preprotein translocase subunit SecY|nr:preprotein translocase subunit SecY [Saccharofermentans sp.]HPE28615.1 preprotein translocase subunit SecY [Saccharofermentans sp.]HPJ81370.1 preprotein translocase subunit SecY [Saccharofermentans sp.]HPQ32015.1 preprotein translocase subunit SecY [Saccharofermentans sp.]HRV50616.1 preprotein translocase subunit SecY [Saccharofermentans sp.]